MSGVIKLAEELGLTQVYDEVIAIEAELVDVTATYELLDMKIKNTGDLVSKVRDEITNRVYRRESDSISMAALDRITKAEIIADGRIAAFTEEIMKWRDELAHVNATKRALDLKHRSRVARMNQTAGYLNFVAAAKQAEAQSFATMKNWPFS